MLTKINKKQLLNLLILVMGFVATSAYGQEEKKSLKLKFLVSSTQMTIFYRITRIAMAMLSIFISRIIQVSKLVLLHTHRAHAYLVVDG